MRRGGYDIGGEQSGHLIFRPHSTTGDGIVAALQVLAIMRETGKSLGDLRKVWEKYPQVQVNVRVRERQTYPISPRLRKRLPRWRENSTAAAGFWSGIRGQKHCFAYWLKGLRWKRSLARPGE